MAIRCFSDGKNFPSIYLILLIYSYIQYRRYYRRYYRGRYHAYQNIANNIPKYNYLQVLFR